MQKKHKSPTRESRLAAERRYRENHRDEIRARGREKMRKRWRENPELEKQKQRIYRQKVREKALILYGAKCVCCGESILNFLTFDHINGGGNKEKKMTGLTGSQFYNNLIKTKRTDIQILCFNCNCARYFYGTCPHHNE